MAHFIDCPSFSVNYNILGLVTVTYGVIHSTPTHTEIDNSISAGGQTFSGYVTSVSTNQIPGTTWFETTVTLTATTN